MKKTHLILSAILASFAFSSAAFAASDDAKCAACTEMKPVPVKVVNPTGLPRNFDKASIEVVLTIDENGVPHDVKALPSTPREIAARVVPAVAQWRFSPKVVDGKPVSARFVLPLDVIGGA